MTQLEYARKGEITGVMKKVARLEGLDEQFICRQVASGRVVIPANIKRRISKPCGIGEGLRTKINANIGTSSDTCDLSGELKKLNLTVSLGCDTVMDLSTGGELSKIRRSILAYSSIPVGTVPIYEAAVMATQRGEPIACIREEEIFEALESQAKDGVDFVTLHCGVTRETIRHLKKTDRLTDVVSRGGAILVEWIIKQGRENPLYEQFDRVLDIARRYDLTLSLGDGMRPGSIHDATDRVQVEELMLLGELARDARAKGVQVMIEGPGHVPINQIEANVVLQKQVCDGAPFYVLGPLVTDVAPGYDHITAAIGGAIAAAKGADFLCYVTPSEHLSLPDLEDVKQGIIASRIAAHAADIAKGVKGAWEWDMSISRARRNRDWEQQIALAIDPEKPARYRNISKPKLEEVCTMCGEYCALKLSDTIKNEREKERTNAPEKRCEGNSAVECKLPKLDVAGSTPVPRSK